MADNELTPDRFALISRALPELSQYMKRLEERQQAQFIELQAQIAQTNAQIIAKLTESDDRRRAETAHLAAILHNWHVADHHQRAQQFQALLHLTSTMIAPQPRLLGNGTASAIAPATLTMPSIPAVVSVAEKASTASPQYDPPAHRMCREINDVADLWQEWMFGIAGQPSIAALDQQWGSRWRAGRPSEVQWYSIRLEVIREIQRVAKDRHITEAAAMQIVASYHRAANQSMDAYCKHLRHQRKHRMALALLENNSPDRQTSFSI